MYIHDINDNCSRCNVRFHFFSSCSEFSYCYLISL
uniref:Uncharacterized protein n=1 Tax=Arundo donax TaxID=35708 RepID=A0A0A9AMA8_ARUDO